MTAETVWESDDGKVRVVHYPTGSTTQPCFLVRDVQRMTIDRRFWYDEEYGTTKEESKEAATERAKQYHEEWYGDQ